MLAMNDPVFERRMEQFRTKVQQHINLADDEISRLTSYLSTIKGDILEANDKLNRLQLRLIQTSQEQSGTSKRQQAALNTKISRIKAAYNKRLQEMNAEHAEETSKLQKNFQKAIDEIHGTLKAKVEQETAPTNELIKQTKAKLQAMQNTFGVSDKIRDDDALEDIKSIQEVEISQQKQLEKAIQKRTQERLDSLLQAKSRLADCVATIDEMERNHETQMNSYKLKLEALDAQYQNKVKRENERQTKSIEALKRKLSESEKRNFSLQRTIHKIEHHHKMQLDATVREGDNLQYSIKTQEVQTQIQLKENDKLKNLMGKLQLLKNKLETRENELINERTDNESLKREINRLKHESQIAKRRQARTAITQL